MVSHWETRNNFGTADWTFVPGSGGQTQQNASALTEGQYEEFRVVLDGSGCNSQIYSDIGVFAWGTDPSITPEPPSDVNSFGDFTPNFGEGVNMDVFSIIAHEVKYYLYVLMTWLN